MTANVIVSFSPESEFEYHVAHPMAPAPARDWLDAQFIALGAEPVRPSGKVLIADKVLATAVAAGAHRFASDAAWAQAFASAAAGALQRDLVRVDVPGTTIGY